MPAAAPGVRRAGPDRAGLRADVLDVPRLTAPAPSPATSPSPRAADFGLDPQRAVEAVADAPARRRAAGLAEQPDRHGADARRRSRRCCEAAPGMVVVDEAYAEFRRPGTASALELLGEHPRLVVTRTMSQGVRLAGARLGYLAASPAVVDAVQLVRLPYHLSAVSQAVARDGAAPHRRAARAGRAAARRARRARDAGCAGRGSRSRSPTRTSCCSDGSRTGTASGRACSTAVC